jgi:hypothetical protein
MAISRASAIDWVLELEQVAHSTSFSDEEKEEEEVLTGTLTGNSGYNHEEALQQPSVQQQPFVLQPMPPLQCQQNQPLHAPPLPPAPEVPPPPPSADGSGHCYEEYLDEGKSKLLLFAIATGLFNGDHLIAEMDDELYKSLMKKVKTKFAKVKIEDYVKEVGCCCKERGLKINKCSNKCKAKVKALLYATLPLKTDDQEFLIEEEAQFLRALEAAAAEKRPSEEANDDWNFAWRMALPFLHLYCCLTLDEVKVLMANEFWVWDKDQLSTRNSDARPPSYFEVLAEKWNNLDLELTTEALPELHSNFAEPILLWFVDMPGTTNAEQIKRKVSGCWASLAEVCCM